MFLTPQGGLTPTSFLLLIGTPLLLSGRYIYGGVICAIALIVAVNAEMQDIKEVEKQEIRYNILEPEELLAELETMEESSTTTPATTEDAETKHTKCLASLAALAKKYNKKDRDKGLGLLCQQAAYLTLKLYPDDYEVTAGAISLLALIAKDPQVRQRSKFQPDVYGFDRPIRSLQKILELAKKSRVIRI